MACLFEIVNFRYFHSLVVHGFFPKIGLKSTFNFFLMPIYRAYIKVSRKQKIFGNGPLEVKLRLFEMYMYPTIH